MRETLKIKLILCPIDFSEFSVSAYQHALSVAAHYEAKLVAQHIVELWRHSSADFAPSAGLYEESCQALRESGKEQHRNSLRSTPTVRFSRSSWFKWGSPQTLFCRLRNRRKPM